MSQSLIALKRPQEGLRLIKSVLGSYPPEEMWGEILAALCMGEAYMGLQDYAQAEKHLTKGLAKATGAIGAGRSGNSMDVYGDIVPFHTNLTDLYLATGQLQKASFHLNKNFPLLKKQPDLLKLSNLHLQAFKLDSLQGNLSSAIEHYQQYKALQDSVFNERKSNQLIAYQVQYETEKKEQQLELKEKDIKLKEQSIQVLSKERVLQQEQIKQATLLRNGIIGGAAMLLLLLGVIYNRYRLKQQSNRLLQAQQSKLQAQHEELQTQQAALQDQQHQIQEKNQDLEQAVNRERAAAGRKRAIAQRDPPPGEKQFADCHELIGITGRFPAG
jgi:tetratricopeptide (TPR) repeat protein